MDHPGSLLIHLAPAPVRGRGREIRGGSRAAGGSEAGTPAAPRVIIMKATSSAASTRRPSPRTLAGRALALAAVVSALGAATGCANVAPYERGKLAHPTMTAASLAGAGESHLRAISEGAIGGSGGTGSGCGCN